MNYADDAMQALDITLSVLVDISFTRYAWDRHLWDIPFSKVASKKYRSI